MSAARLPRLAITREGWFVLFAVLATAVVMFLSIGETFTSPDLDRIRAAEGRLEKACESREDATSARSAVAELTRYARRNPTQPLPLHGAAPADGMRAELTEVRATLSSTACASDAALQVQLNAAIAFR